MRKKSNKTPRESSGAFRNMAIVIFAPAAILLVLVLILTGINYYSISNSTKKSSHQVVKSFFQYNEALIQNFASALLILDDNSELMQALISTDYSYDPENFKRAAMKYAHHFLLHRKYMYSTKHAIRFTPTTDVSESIHIFRTNVYMTILTRRISAISAFTPPSAIAFCSPPGWSKTEKELRFCRL